MATSLAMKRMARERQTLETPNEDYIVHFQDDNLLKFDAYVLGPANTLYSHKFIKLHIEIPDGYPLVPPKCKFIQHTGGRIHPNLYVDGKVCLSILGTWEGEKWAIAMSCNTVLITIRSLLDNSPYKHEPHQQDNKSYNDYVQHNTWRWLLLDYMRHEQEPVFKAFLQKYVARNGEDLVVELQRQAMEKGNVRQLFSPYVKNEGHVANWPGLIRDVEACVRECKLAVEGKEMEEMEKKGHDETRNVNEAVFVTAGAGIDVANGSTRSPATQQPRNLPANHGVIVIDDD